MKIFKSYYKRRPHRRHSGPEGTVYSEIVIPAIIMLFVFWLLYFLLSKVF